MMKKGSLFLVLFSFLTVLALPEISYSQSANDGFNPNANGIVWSIAVQADGKILIAGEFTTIGTPPGTTRNHIARLNPDGSLDTGFVSNADSTVYSIAVQADGKILVGGSFTAIGGATRNCIARLNPDGTLDDGFISPNVNGSVYAIAVQAGGKILIGGLFTKIGVEDRNYIARLNPDGSLDTGFVPNADSTVDSIVVQADEKIVVGGYFTAIDGVTRNCIARLYPDGTLDTDFNPDTNFPPDTNNYVYSIAVQADGRILVGGEFIAIGGGPPYIARLNPDGSLDVDFKSNANGLVRSIAVQADGKILIGGKFTTIGTSPTITRNHIARLNSDGAPDESFDTGSVEGGTYEWVYSIAVQSDGKILVGGSFTSIDETPRNRIARLYPDGGLDKDVDPNGNVGWGSGWGIQCVGLQADGKILIGGEFTTIGGTTSNNIARLNPDGSLDIDFNPNANGLVRSIAVQADGKILIGGKFTTVGGKERSHYARLNSDGTLDESFPTFLLEGGDYEWVYSIAVQSDGKILVGGSFTAIGYVVWNRIARFYPNGNLEGNFDPNPNSRVRSFALQADGKIVVVGEFTAIGGKTRNHIARLNSDGTLDSSFIDPQVARGGQWGSVYSIVIQADEKILVGGWFSSIGGTTRNNIARLNKEGTIDNSFNADVNGGVGSIAVQADGKILIVGDFTTIGTSPVTTRNGIARLNPDGSVDTTFNPDANGWVLTTAIQADGKILVGGQFTDIGGVTRRGIARITNTDAAIQELVVSSDGSSVTWMRGQASPEVWRVTFEHSPDGVTWSPLGNGTRISGGWQLTGFSLPVNENHYVRARGYATGGSQNVSGMLFESVRSLTVIPSALEPVVSSFKINAGAASTAKGTVTLNNVATNKPSHYIATELQNFDWASWQPYSTAPIFNLSTGSGKKTVYFKVKNSSGESAWVSDSIEALDPTVTSLKINAGALSTQNQLVTLNNTATNLPTHYMASESDTFAGAIWLQYSTAPSFALGTRLLSGSGTKTVYFKVKNAFAESDSITDTIETLAPTVTSLKINAGAASTTNNVVTLNNTATNLPLYYKASEREDFLDTWWQLYSIAPKFTLSAGAGPKTVYFEVANGFDQSTVKRDTIEALAPTVTSFKINAGAASTVNGKVTLNNVATNGPTHYMASEWGDFQGAGWQKYSTAPSFELNPGGGTRTVYFKVRNGVAESDVMSDTIVGSDLSPVVTSFKINAGAASTAKALVTLNNTATNFPLYYMASESPSFSGAGWWKYSRAPSFALSSGAGMKTVYFKTLNIYYFGESPVKSDTIVALAPAVTSFKINAGAASTANSLVTLNNVATNSPTHYMVSENSGFSGTSWLPYSTAPKFTLSPGAGPKTVYFKVRNSIADSPEPAKSATIEALAPIVTSFKINAGAASAANSVVTLNNVATKSPTHYMASEKSDFSDASWQTYSTSPSFNLSDVIASPETKKVYFKVKNSITESNVMNDEISAGGSAPVVTSFKINAGALKTASGTVTLNNTATNAPTHYMASEDSGFSGADWMTYSAAPKFTLSAGSGMKKVYFKVKNIFGPSSDKNYNIEALAPVVTSFKINAGAANTANSVVTLNNVATNSPTHFKAASKSEDLVGASWMPYSTAPKFTLSDGSGEKKVYFKVKNSFAESGAISDAILASGLPPVVTSFKINAGALSTLNYLVTLNNTGTNFPMYYMASEDPGFAWASWQPYSTAPKFQLMSWGTGAKTVYFKTRNMFGESSVVSDTISSPDIFD
jgi:uncharacterized delta-60 repeat protein